MLNITRTWPGRRNTVRIGMARSQPFLGISSEGIMRRIILGLLVMSMQCLACTTFKIQNQYDMGETQFFRIHNIGQQIVNKVLPDKNGLVMTHYSFTVVGNKNYSIKLGLLMDKKVNVALPTIGSCNLIMKLNPGEMKDGDTAERLKIYKTFFEMFDNLPESPEKMIYDMAMAEKKRENYKGVYVNHAKHNVLILVRCEYRNHDHFLGAPSLDWAPSTDWPITFQKAAFLGDPRLSRRPRR